MLLLLPMNFLQTRIFTALLFGDALLLAMCGRLAGFSFWIRACIRTVRERLRANLRPACIHGLYFPFFDGRLARAEVVLDPFCSANFFQSIATHVWRVNLEQQSDVFEYLTRNHLSRRSIFLDWNVNEEGVQFDVEATARFLHECTLAFYWVPHVQAQSLSTIWQSRFALCLPWKSLGILLSCVRYVCRSFFCALLLER